MRDRPSHVACPQWNSLCAACNWISLLLLCFLLSASQMRPRRRLRLCPNVPRQAFKPQLNNSSRRPQMKATWRCDRSEIQGTILPRPQQAPCMSRVAESFLETRGSLLAYFENLMNAPRIINDLIPQSMSRGRCLTKDSMELRSSHCSAQLTVP